MKEECQQIIDSLNLCPINVWAESFVNFKMNFWRKYCKGLIFSTSHGLDFFIDVLKGLDGEEWEGEGEYEENFRKFIKAYRK